MLSGGDAFADSQEGWREQGCWRPVGAVWSVRTKTRPWRMRDGRLTVAETQKPADVQRVSDGASRTRTGDLLAAICAWIVSQKARISRGFAELSIGGPQANVGGYLRILHDSGTPHRECLNDRRALS
jgi:hypothetical protein